MHLKNTGIQKKEKKSIKEEKTIERQFGSAKEFHGFRYTNMKGIQKMRMKVALTFACLNMKKLAKMLWKTDSNGGLLVDKISNFYKNARKFLENLIFTRTNPGFPGFVFNLNRASLPSLYCLKRFVY